MQFVNPLFLFALAAISVPVIIHLFNFRKYKKIFFTNVRFLAEIKQESKKRSELKHLLILLMRILATACLVIAFAQPYLSSPLQQKKMSGRQAVSIFIDNSFSMDALATNGKLVDVAKSKALEIAAAYKPSDLFQLLTTDLEGKHQRFVNRDEFRNLVEEVTVSPAFKPLSSIIQRQEDQLKKITGANRSAYIISDFQKTSSDLFRLRSDTTITYFFIPIVAEKTSNLFIDSVWFDSPSQQSSQAVKLKIKIRNIGSELLEKIPVKLSINKMQKGVASFSVEPDGETVITLPYTNNEQGIQYGLLSIVDYPVTWDDKFYFTYPILPRIPVLCINGEKQNPYLNALFENDSTVQLKNEFVKQLDYSSFMRYPLIILNGIEELSTGLSEELKRFLDGGGNLLIFPASDINADSYNSFLSSLELPVFSGIDTTRLRVTGLNSLSRIYNDVFEKDASGRVVLPDNMDMPVSFKHYVTGASTHSGQEVLLKLQNDQSFLGVSGVRKGFVYLSSVPLEESWSNFMKHPLFVPTLYRIALLSQSSPALYYRVGSDNPIEIRNDTTPDDKVFIIRKLDSDFEFIPELRSIGGSLALFPHDMAREAGHYNVCQGKQVVHGVAFNYNRTESDLRCFSVSELQKELKHSSIKYHALFQGKKAPLTKEILEMSQGTPLWKLFIILTLVFLAIEVILIRIMKE
jgi:hypothetical protein